MAGLFRQRLDDENDGLHALAQLKEDISLILSLTNLDNYCIWLGDKLLLVVGLYVTRDSRVKFFVKTSWAKQVPNVGLILNF